MTNLSNLCELKSKAQVFKKQGQTTKAILEYSKIIILINQLFKTESLLEPDELYLVKEILIPTLLKLASCYLVQSDSAKVIAFAENVLEISQGSSKAYYYRARGHYSNRDYEKALKDLSLARENDPSNEKYRDLQSIIRKSRHRVVKNLSCWTTIGKLLTLHCKRRVFV